MSYILEALRRAEAERREREAQSQLSKGPSAEAWLEAPTPGVPPVTGRLRWFWPLLAGALGLTLLTAVLWQRQAAAPSPRPERPPEPAVAPARPVQTAAAPVPAVPRTALQAPPALPPAVPVDQVQQPPAPATTRARVVPAERGLPTPAATAAVRLPTLAELPDGLRQQLPALQTSGAMYSENPADRMLILNNRVMHEGEQVTPELKLEQIRLKSAVLLFRGQRFTLQY